MKVALVSDVHGNLPALEAVLADARQVGAEAVWNLGDCVGYGPFPDEVVRRLRDVTVAGVIGNYDQKVLAFERVRSKWRQKKDLQKYLAFEFAWEHLSPGSRAHLASLPEQVRLDAAGLRVLLVHGSPAAVDEALTGRTPTKRLRELADLADADVVACGHSHVAFETRVGGVTFVNPGSVGRPEGRDARAAYAVLDLAGGRVRVDPRRVRYDVSATVAAVRACNLPESFSRMFLQGQNLDQVRASNGSDGDSSALDAAEAHRVLDSVLRLAESCHYEADHSRQVARLALMLFDALADLHGLGGADRRMLHWAGLLHDIGWSQGRKGHHKTAMRLILACDFLALDSDRKGVLACLARYHRKALPAPGHEMLDSLDAGAQRRVWLLGGLLRLADGLDRTHRDRVQHCRAAVDGERLVVTCRSAGRAELEQAAGQKKADMLARALGRPVVVCVVDGASDAARSCDPPGK